MRWDVPVPDAPTPDARDPMDPRGPSGAELMAAYSRVPRPLRRRLGMAEGLVAETAVAHDLADVDRRLPAWLRSTEAENKLPASLAVALAIVLQALLPQRLSLHPRLLLPVVEALLLVGLTVANPMRLTRHSPAIRVASLAMTGVLILANGISAGLLADRLVSGAASDDAGALLLSGGSIYLTNVIGFSLLYWELDRGGPVARAAGRSPYPDLLFPQQATPEVADPSWQPMYVDYLYVSVTNATAFSPTDTLPLARWAKGAMALQSAVALVTVALVIARAVNVLR